MQTAESKDFVLLAHQGEILPEKTRKHPPKAILRVHVIEIVFHRFDGRHAAENEYFRLAVNDGGEGVFDVPEHFIL